MVIDEDEATPGLTILIYDIYLILRLITLDLRPREHCYGSTGILSPGATFAARVCEDDW